MKQTVIGIFNNEDNAKAAVKQLLRDGFQEKDVDISGKGIDDYANSQSGGVYKDDGDSIGSFFRSIFGTANEASDYADVARRGCIVTVHVNSLNDAERAADLLDLFGAVDVNEKVAYLRNSEHQKLDEKNFEKQSSEHSPSSEQSIQSLGDNRKRSFIVSTEIKEQDRLKTNSLSKSVNDLKP